MSVDFVFHHEGSVWLCEPQHEAAEHALVALKTGDEECLWLAKALVVEPRYVEGLAERLEGDGWRVEI